jgi:titin
LFCSEAASNHVEGCYLGLKPDGTNAAPNFLTGTIFQFGAHDNVIGGLNATQRNIISGNTEYGVILNDTNSDRNILLGNYIGLNAAGTIAAANGYSGIGIWDGPAGTIIGGATTGARNVISGNVQYGIYLSDSNVSGVTIQGNFIGTDFSGSNSIPNGNAITNSYAGIGIFSGAHGNIIGGASALARNVISGNTNVGIYLANSGVTNNVVLGNYIGVDVSGTTALTRQHYGIYLIDGASGNTIGGASAGAGNVISGNLQYGLYISDPGTSNNFVLGNFIGPDATGTNAIGNGSFGIGLWSGASGNTIGGAATGAGNLLSGNPDYGVALAGVSGNVIQGNYIGADLSGKRALGNNDQLGGIGIWGGSANNLIGGTSPGAGNLISGNRSYGLFLEDPGTTGNLVQGNLIGADLTGTNALGNSFAGVALWNGATNNVIGGLSAGAGNVIAFNGWAGVELYDAPTIDNSIRGNSIFDNDALGIDLGGDGITLNHSGFLAGPNDLQNFPVITNAFGYGDSTIICGTLNSLANGTFFIDVYRNSAADGSGYGQGRFYLGTVSVSTDGSGNATFALTNHSGNYAGLNFAATATSTGGDTSEFGQDVIATNQPAPSAVFSGPFLAEGNGFIFALTLETNFNYRIQTATNLGIHPIPWVDLTNFTAASSSLVFTDRTAANYPTRFYRVVSP